MPLEITDRAHDAQPYRDDALDGRISAAGLAGATLERGLLRFHTAETGPEAARMVGLHFPPGRTAQWVPFAVDWRGRQYCRVQEQGVDTVVRVDPAVFAPEQVIDFDVFMGTVLTDPSAARVLGAEECAAALAGRGLDALEPDRCFGYVLPPYAGGADRPDNLLDVPVGAYWAAMADLKNQWDHRPRGAHALDVAHRHGGLTFVFDVDQDPEFSPGAGTRAERLVVTSATGPVVYNHGLAREPGDQADAAADAVREAFGGPEAAQVLLIDWHARCYLREPDHDGHGAGNERVVRYDLADLTRTDLADADEFARRLEAADASLLEVFGEADKSRQCARLRIAEIPAGASLVPAAPPSVAGPEAADPDRFRIMQTDVFWWMATSLPRVAGQLEPGVRLQGYLISPEGRMGLQQAAHTAPTAAPAPWEDTALIPPVPTAPRFVPLAETGVVQTGLDEDQQAPGDEHLARQLTWYGLPGRVYNAGLFRFLGADASARAVEHLREAFGAQAAGAVPVIVDWLGRYTVHEVVEGAARLVSYDVTRNEREELAAFDEGLQQILLTPVARDLFDEDGFTAAREQLGLQALEDGMCVGVKVPAFLGGPDSVDNLEPDRLDVHWLWHGRVLAQVRTRPPGTPIESIGMDDDGHPVVRFADGAPAQPAVDEPPREERPRGIFGRLFKG